MKDLDNLEGNALMWLAMFLNEMPHVLLAKI